ncbi:unnamed protein product [Adineta steineri]|uniref:Uncharacterized protein n=1 Tax=Adineta steineri TaxID=433720 RepID=A0A813R8I5_9BILA|nr:unnamed protein product [Adineta steineri]CAF3541628.1 unnamed protein product [Adineta steineri]
MSANFFRYQYKQRYLVPLRQPFHKYDSSSNERLCMIQLDRPRTKSILSYYDNDEMENGNKLLKSKWIFIRQRLPEILALSSSYKPANLQTQLTLLVGMMNRQTKNINNDHDYNLSHIPSNVTIDIGGRRRLIYLKRIPPDQMIHVDLDQLSFSLPTRQLILAISRGNAYQTASKYCPPAITDLLINLSQTKIVNDGRKYKRALYKMLIGKIIFFIIFIFISGMMFTLVISTTNTLFKLNSFNYTNPTLLVTNVSLHTETE